MTFKCNICFKEFDKKFNLDRHVSNKKKPCKPVLLVPPISTNAPPEIHQKTPENAINSDKSHQNEQDEENEITKSLTCVHCDLLFTRKDTLKRHMESRCKVKKLLDQEKERQNEQFEELKQLIYQQSKEIADLKKQKPTSITINNTDNSVKNNVSNNVNNSVNNIKLMAHGSEDLSKIETKTILKYLCSDKFESIVPNVTKEIFRNKERPEFLNLEVTDLARNKAKYYDGDNWVTGNANDCAMTVFENVNSRILEPFEEDNIEKTVNMIIKDKELKPNYKTINYSRNYCGKLFSEDKEYIDQRNKICENIKNMMYSKKCGQIK